MTPSKGGNSKSKRRNWMPHPEDTEKHPNRTLILCFDGTGDQFDDDVSLYAFCDSIIVIDVLVTE
jgi:uncharacterized protein (DUF2235 family)